MFKNLFSRARKSDTPPSPPPLALQSVIQKQLCPNGVQPLPKNARVAFEISTNPNTEAKDIIPIIESDEAFAAKILKVGNSAYFNRGNKVTSVKDAVHLIGLSEVCSMLSCSCLHDIFPSSSQLRQSCWKHNVTTALLAKMLCETLRLGKASSHFTAGLLHDLGKLAIIQRFPAEYEKLHKVFYQKGGSFTEMEKELFPFDHCQVGAMVATKWNFSEETIDVIVGHHASWEQLSKAPLTRAIKLAQLLSYRLSPEWDTSGKKFKEQIEQELADGWSKFAVFPKKAAELLAKFSVTLEDELSVYSMG